MLFLKEKAEIECLVTIVIKSVVPNFLVPDAWCLMPDDLRWS